MKQMRAAAVLVVILLALGGIATWDEWQTKKDVSEEKAKTQLTTFDMTNASEIDFVSRPQEEVPVSEGAEANAPVHVRLIKKDGSWMLTAPIEAKADEATISNLLQTVKDYSFAKAVSKGTEKWQEFGLKDSQRELTVRTGGEKPKEFAVFVGKKAPVGYNVYMRTSASDEVYIGSQHLLTSLTKTLFDFRDKSFVKMDLAALKGLIYERQGQSPIEIARQDGKYVVTKPTAIDADQMEIKDFIDELSRLQATGFVDQPSSKLIEAFKTPTYMITWFGETGEPVSLRFVEDNDKLLAAYDANHRAFELPEDFKARLRKNLDDFRNRRVLGFSATDVKSVEIDGEVFRSVAGAWYTAADAEKLNEQGEFKGKDSDKPKEKAHIRVLLVDLEFARTDQFLDAHDPQLKGLAEAPQHRIKLGFNDTARAALVMDLYPGGAPDKFFVKTSVSPTIYRIPQNSFSSMVPAASSSGENGPGAEFLPMTPGEGMNSAPYLDDGSNEDEIQEDAHTG